MTPTEVLTLYEHLQTSLQEVQREIDKTAQRCALLQETLDYCKAYRAKRVEGVLAQVAQLVNSLLEVIDPHLKFSVEVSTENATCQLKITKEGEQFEPRFELGGGVIDVVAAGLRLGLWSMGSRTPLLVLDEPFRFLSRNYKPLIASLLEEIVKEMPHVSILMVTHDPDLIPSGARIYDLTEKRWTT